MSRRLAQILCDQRAKHAHARATIIEDMTKIIETLGGATNNDRDRNLPLTVGSIQVVVKNCLERLESQQNPHNFVMRMLPESNATFCRVLGSERAIKIKPANWE